MRRGRHTVYNALKKVSIHAPTRGATFAIQNTNILYYVSIHAPTRGATQLANYCKCSTKRFNPRTHTGCDLQVLIITVFVFLFQSTHPHGVRLCINHKIIRILCFNPRTHTGCDAKSRDEYSIVTSFNPRTHTGCDVVFIMFSAVLHVSIHAPTRGATFVVRIRFVFEVCFNPRTHTGCDSCDIVIAALVLLFQSTHPHGVRPANRSQTFFCS